MKRWRMASLVLGMGAVCCALAAQDAAAPAKASADAPAKPSTDSATRTFHDPAYKLSFDYPANWVFTQHDHEISTFRLDARSAVKKTQMRTVASMPANPFPQSTFSGAYLYFSVTPHSNDASCARQAAPAKAGRRSAVSEIAGINFAHGHDEQTAICVVQRDEIYTTLRHGSCYRFDLAINTFCGGEVSGVKDITEEELDQVRGQLTDILGSVRFDPK